MRVQYYIVQVDAGVLTEDGLREVPGVLSVKEHDTSEHAYWASVRDIARDAFDTYGYRAQRAQEYIEESVDGSWWVTYTHASIAVLLHSDNEAAWQELYSELPAKNWLAVAACCAMLADAREAYQTLVDEE